MISAHSFPAKRDRVAGGKYFLLLPDLDILESIQYLITWIVTMVDLLRVTTARSAAGLAEPLWQLAEQILLI